MAKDISIVFKAVDNLTNSVQQMRSSTKGLSKDISDYKKIQDEAFKNRAEVKLETSKAKQALKELEKAVKDGKDGAEQAYQEQQKYVEQLGQAYKNLGKTIGEASREERKLTDNIARNASTESINKKGIGNTMSQLSKAGLINMAGNSASNFAGTFVTSALGSNAGGAVNNILSGAASGAAMGSIIPGIGTAVGAGIGAVSGVINTATQRLEKKDDIFKDEVKSTYDLLKQNSQADLTQGIASYSQREKDLISFETLLGGKENSTKFINDAQKFGQETPFETKDILNTSKKLMTFGYKQEDIIPLMRKIGDAGSALGMSNEDMGWVATSLGRMKVTNKASLEFLNPLLERGIPVYDYLAKSLHKSKEDVMQMLNDGIIPGAKASEAIAHYMGKAFSGNMEKQSKTYAGMMSNLDEHKENINMAQGEGYETKRKQGLEGELDFYDRYNDKLKQASKETGAWKAHLDNLKEQKVNLSVANMMDSKEYNEADEAHKGMLIEKAKADGMMQYKGTEEYQAHMKAEMDLVAGIQAGVSPQYVELGSSMADAFSKGFGERAIPAVQGILSEITSMLESTGGATTKQDNTSTSGIDAWAGNKIEWAKNSIGNLFTGHAVGMDYVPYNGYPALLHEGEKVLTKSQANTDNAPQGIVINMNNTVREDADIQRITQALVSELAKYQGSYGGAY